MKKIFLALLFSLVTVFAFSQDKTVVEKSGRIVWDMPTIDVEGNPIPASELSFELFLVENPYDTNNPGAPFASSTTNSYDYTLTDTRKYAVGVRTIRTIDTDSVISDIAWSIVSADVNPAFGTFVIRYIPGAGKPKNVKRE